MVCRMTRANLALYGRALFVCLLFGSCRKTVLRAFTAVATGGAAAAAAANAETEFHHERNLALFSFPPFDC